MAAPRTRCGHSGDDFDRRAHNQHYCGNTSAQLGNKGMATRAIAAERPASG